MCICVSQRHRILTDLILLNKNLFFLKNKSVFLIELQFVNNNNLNSAQVLETQFKLTKNIFTIRNWEKKLPTKNPP